MKYCLGIRQRILKIHGCGILLRELGLAWTMGRGIRGRTEEKQDWPKMEWWTAWFGFKTNKSEENIVHQGTGSGVNQTWFRSLASSFSTSVTLDKCPDLSCLDFHFYKVEKLPRYLLHTLLWEIKQKDDWDFLGGPVVLRISLHHKGRGFYPWSGTKTPRTTG